MNRIITYNFTDNFIDKTADFLCQQFLKNGNDLSRVACVFGGKRPALFLRRVLSKKIKKSLLPPYIFSIDEFVDYIILKKGHFGKITDLDACFLIYTLAKKHIPGLLKGEKSFSEFLPWSREIIAFIEQLDLEDIKNQSLGCIEKSAAIGYEIPENINHLLQQIITLRGAYHKALCEKNIYSRGMRYLWASNCVDGNNFEEFDAVLFCNFFYLRATEQKIINNIYEKGKGVCIFQGSEDEWPVLKREAEKFGVSIRPEKENAVYSEQSRTTEFNLSFYQGFDVHSQVCLVREILSKVKNKNNSVIVLPRPEAVIPLLTEISSVLDEFNVSMGYPLKRSPLYALFDALLKVQESKRDDKYYTKDYLNLLRHPLIKNLKIGHNFVITRVMVHKIEELLQGSEETSIGGSLFLRLGEIENEEKIYLRTAQALRNMKISANIDECKSILKKLHVLLIQTWEELTDFKGFACALDALFSVLIEKSMLTRFPLNLKAIEKLQAIAEEFRNFSFSKERFDRSEMREIFRQKVQSEKISFVGSPLKGIQILGLFETRSLNFEEVIVMDMNESVLPKLKIYEPLIPREVMLNLGLNRLEKEEEIQRYQFMRLISAAKKAHLVYEKNQEKEKSRFVEELLWQRQKKSGKIEVAAVPKISFLVKAALQATSIKKTVRMLEFLKKSVYSASRINTYLKCPLQFYYRYVLGLKENEDLLEDVQASHIGIFIHKLLEDTFKKFIGRRPVIDAKFKKHFFEKMEEMFEKNLARRMKSDSFLLKGIIKNRLNKFLNKEIERNVTKVICLEQGCTGIIKLNNEPVQFRYTIDRIDEFSDKSIVVIDYKTGGVDLIPKKFSILKNIEVNRESIRDNIKSFQLPIYYYFTLKDFPSADINAEFYSLRMLERKAFISRNDLPHKEKIMEICLKALESILIELFDPDMPFEPDKEERRCQHCPFSLLCR